MIFILNFLLVFIFNFHFEIHFNFQFHVDFQFDFVFHFQSHFHFDFKTHFGFKKILAKRQSKLYNIVKEKGVKETSQPKRKRKHNDTD